MSEEITVSRSEQLRKHMATDRQFMALCTCTMCHRARRTLADLLDAIQGIYARIELLAPDSGSTHEPPSRERKALDEVLTLLKNAHHTASNSGHPPSHS